MGFIKKIVVLFVVLTIGVASSLMATQSTDTNKSDLLEVNTALTNTALSDQNLYSKSLATRNNSSDEPEQISNPDKASNWNKSYWLIFSLIMAAFLLEIIRILRIYCIIKGWKGKLFTTQEKIRRMIFTILIPLMIDGIIIFVFLYGLPNRIWDLHLNAKVFIQSDLMNYVYLLCGIVAISGIVRTILGVTNFTRQDHV